MKKVKYFIFGILLLLSCDMTYAKTDVSIKSITPVYDKESSILVTETESAHNVVFNDKGQNVKYNVVIENTTNKDLSVQAIKLTTPSENFLKYELEGLKYDDIIKANSTKNVVISLSTIKQDGWGRNFDDKLTATISLGNPITNPDTSVDNPITSIIVAIISIIGMTISIITLKKQGKIAIFIIVLAITANSLIPVVKANQAITLDINITVSFDSKNKTSKSYVMEEYCENLDGETYCSDEKRFIHFWDDYNTLNYIKNVYIENEIKELENVIKSYDISEKQDESVKAYIQNNKDDLCYDTLGRTKGCYDLHIQSDGIIYPNHDMSYFFHRMYNLDTIYNLKGLDTSEVTDMSYMFNYAGMLNTNFTLDLTNLNTANVTNMSWMFSGAGSHSSTSLLDITHFNTSNVVNMTGMFQTFGQNTNVFSLNLSGIDTSKVTNMSYMFNNAGQTSIQFDLNFEGIDTKNVTNMVEMFGSIGSYTTNYTLDLSNLNTANVTNMSWMFRGAGKNSVNFTLKLNGLDTSNVTSMKYMFYEAGSNSTNFTINMNEIDTSNVTDMSHMFRDSRNINGTITIKNPNTADYDRMFYNNNGGKVIVNYTSKTSDLVDKMISTKSSNSNVLKGVQAE